MRSDAHIGELAELYAAGALDARERAIVEAHLLRCAQCLRRTGEAEETVLALEQRFEIPSGAGSALQPLALRSGGRFWSIAAMAAALIVGFVLPHPRSPQSPATLAMIQSHFSHAQFAGRGPDAKVIYARDRSWYYVIVQGSHRLPVYGLHGANVEPLGTTQATGLTSELFVRGSQRFDAIALRGGDVIETANLH